MTRACTALLLLTAVASANQPTPMTPAEMLGVIKKRQKDAEQTLQAALGNSPENRKQTNELWQAYYKEQTERFAAAYAIAKADPTSDTGFAALEWILTFPRSYTVPVGKMAMELITDHHAANPKVGKVIACIGYLLRDRQSDSYAAGQALIKAVAEKNPDRAARGQAHLALAMRAGWAFAVAEYQHAPDVEKLAAEAEAKFDALIKEYGDCPRLIREDDVTIGEFAKSELFELRHLRVGKVAPDLAGDDLDGTKFKLGDSRGKVTVLVFWATWCGPCMAQVPHERKLVERMKDKPFAMVGVNGDDDRAKAKDTTKKHGMTWQSFWNGKKGADGPITRAWNVRAWPTVYVLDAHGVIRFKGVHGEQLDKAVDQLVGELESK